VWLRFHPDAQDSLQDNISTKGALYPTEVSKYYAQLQAARDKQLFSISFLTNTTTQSGLMVLVMREQRILPRDLI